MEFRAAFGELRADGVPEPVSRDGAALPAAPAGRADQPGGLAGRLKRVLEQVAGRQQHTVIDEQVADLDMSPRERLKLTADLVHGDGLRCFP